MSDAISRQAAIRWIKTECNPYGKPTLDYETSCRIMEHLDRMPSAQPEIVHCRECRHSYVFEPWDGKDASRYCKRLRRALCRDSDLCVDDDDFCSRAERKDGEADETD